jgi:hypothetical protein
MQKIIAALVALSTLAGLAYAAGDLPTKFSNRGSIMNTRHNLTQRQMTGGPSGTNMDPYRNDYQEFCVYCHTPHGGNGSVNLPLWNRTLKATKYTTYNELGSSSLTQEVSQPGNNSLACLSCHDGQTAVDSIINMPGSGRYSKSQETSQDNGFLDSWDNARGPDATVHAGLTQQECLACHSADAGKVLGAGAADFTAAAIGTDLRNDHPVGVTFPATTGSDSDFKTPTGAQGSALFFDVNNSGRMDSGDIRMYATGGKAQVECASCHDPHGVPSAGRESDFFPTFLRMSNAGSGLCLTCHNK